MDEVLVEEYREELLECTHRGHICIVSDTGEVKYSVGDENLVAYLRSSAKPIQAIPIIKYGIADKYNFTDKEITILAGSHYGESFHVEALKSIMKKIEVKEEDFVCLPTYPYDEISKVELIKNQHPKSSIYHNCSGKHLGIMALCKYLGCGIEDYWDIENAAEQEILEQVSIISDYPKEAIKIGVDGCGVPVFAMPLKYMARAYLRMACPDLIEQEDVRNSVIQITRLMNQNSEMVSGTNRICSIVLKDPNIVAKGGAQGVYCFGLRDERLGIAIKLMDGIQEQRPLIIASILEQINYKNKETIKSIYDAFPLEIKNDNNKIIGTIKTSFKL